MRVLIVHNRYQQAGGEDAVVENEQALLERHGWQTRLWSVTNEAIAGTWNAIRVAARTSYSRPARDKLARVIAEFAPAVVHVHNFFPLLSPSIYDACRAAGVAVVQTLHNYRAICANPALTRGGHSCFDCINGSPYQAVLHGCYRGSRIASLPVARMIDVHRRKGTWSQKVDRFIALSGFSRGKFVEAGFPADRIDVKPNFVEDRPASPPAVRSGALYVGRLSSEKGIDTLLRAWTGVNVPLRVIGDGPMRQLVESAAGPSIMFLGRKTSAEVVREMAQAAFLVQPSVGPETFGMAIAEAYCQSLPVIASRIGALAEIVREKATGLLFSPGDADDLAAKVRWAYQCPDTMRIMGLNARSTYVQQYSPSVNFRIFTAIYERAIGQPRS